MEPHEHEALGDKLINRIIVAKCDWFEQQFFVLERIISNRTYDNPDYNYEHRYYAYSITEKIFLEISRNKVCIRSLLETGEYEHKLNNSKDYVEDKLI